jgi:hypothetical protein
MIISRSIIFRTKSVSDKFVEKNQNTHFVFNKPFPEKPALYGLTRKNMVQPAKSQMAIQYGAEKMQHACRITETKRQTQTYKI